ncbi:DUF6708 domain-containing protein [Stenotrophomonas maltophilia]|uniref:DUF6708 domain-containing protein n=1 Tax=Stenotrophomonas maltophilia TaxID=40324 RepID=A0AAI9C478_STEMA|nr:DUF6708 domain-containing protein [Stenotrophomonas maltophilia]EKT4093810.1 hypothetical protein [Stenotrophomonas maltophilia]UUS14070.1 hypothetical protein NMB32_19800 [Stenotrophomonas sp. CD2]HEL4101875.1 hypothetical protein [Stenotrophomonas maltophilia]HEL5043969.1 hypothetical protein [Stenotrophomonas maltophilia]
MTSSSKRSGEVRVDEWEGEEPYFDIDFSKKRSKGEGQVGVFQPRRILNSSEDVSVHSSPSSSDCVISAHENGILVSSIRGSASPALLAWFGFLPSCGLLAAGCYAIYILTRLGAGAVEDPGFALAILFAAAISFFVGISAFSVLFRILVIMPSDFPIIFNRKTGDVWVAIPRMPSFIRVFELQPVTFERYSWESLRPRIYRFLEVTPGVSSARWSYILTLVFGQENDPKKVARELNIGFKGWGDDFELLQLWEHIRRYMNDGGPALDQGEKFKTFSTGRLPKFPDEAMAALGRKLSESEAWAAPKA